MRLTRCYVDAALSVGSRWSLPASTSTHLLRVLRLRTGAPLVLFNGRGGEYRCTLTGDAARVAEVSVDEHLPVERESGVQTILVQGISRGERMDAIVQKATELGVSRIAPVLTEFSVVKLDAAAASRRLEHWQAIAIAAAEQCGRNRLPTLRAVSSLREALPEVATAFTTPVAVGIVLAADAPISLTATLKTALADDRSPQSIAILIGPEGGLSPDELTAAQTAGFTPASLGPRVLRTETAPLAALAAIQTLIGDMN